MVCTRCSKLRPVHVLELLLKGCAAVLKCRLELMQALFQKLITSEVFCILPSLLRDELESVAELTANLDTRHCGCNRSGHRSEIFLNCGANSCSHSEGMPGGTGDVVSASRGMLDLRIRTAALRLH